MYAVDAWFTTDIRRATFGLHQRGHARFDPPTPLLSCPRRPRIGLTTRIARQRTPARSLKRCLKLQPNHRHDTLWYLCQPNAMGFMVSRRILVRLSFTAACTRAIIHSIK
ncbi:hypothetical protein Pcac1_g28804 [Phytophthora cactorum]|nr:hypothetical protein Pcac1_g28804 [Phytophthora cactorum]